MFPDTGNPAGSRSGKSQSHRLRSGNPIASGCHPSSGGARDAAIPLGRVTHQSQAPQEYRDGFVDGHSGLLIGGQLLPVVVAAGEVAASHDGLAGLSLQAAPLCDPIREPATLPVVLNFGLRVPALRLRIAPVPAVLCVSAGPAKGSVFQKVGQIFKSLFHVREIGMGTEQCGQQKLRIRSPK